MSSLVQASKLFILSWTCIIVGLASGSPFQQSVINRANYSGQSLGMSSLIPF